MPQPDYFRSCTC